MILHLKKSIKKQSTLFYNRIYAAGAGSGAGWEERFAGWERKHGYLNGKN